MGRPQSVDVHMEEARITSARAGIERAPLLGWRLGWTRDQQAEAQCWLEFGRSQARRMLARLRKIEAERIRRKRCHVCRLRYKSRRYIEDRPEHDAQAGHIWHLCEECFRRIKDGALIAR